MFLQQQKRHALGWATGERFAEVMKLQHAVST